MGKGHVGKGHEGLRGHVGGWEGTCGERSRGGLEVTWGWGITFGLGGHMWGHGVSRGAGGHMGKGHVGLKGHMGVMWGLGGSRGERSHGAGGGEGHMGVVV